MTAAIAAGAALPSLAMAMDTPQPTTQPIINNDSGQLVPKTTFAGKHLQFDFPSLHIGCAEYDEGPTGCTVFYFPNGPAITAADVRGGMHCSIYMDYIEHDQGVVDAICLAGGSIYGLEASTGVTAELLARRGYVAGRLPFVTGSILWDFHGRSNSVYPDKNLGRAALRAAKPNAFPLGACGAGRNTKVGSWWPDAKSERGGQGAAFHQEGPTKIAVFSVVNASGALVNRRGEVVRGHYVKEKDKRFRMFEFLEMDPANQARIGPPPGNTTLTVVVTNQKLHEKALRHFAKQVHASMARAIDPFHCHADGDILYAVSTMEVENEKCGLERMSVLASEVAWDAVLNCYES